MIKDNGGPAYPCGRRFELGEGWQQEDGMSLRDYFAAKYMQGVSAKSDTLYELKHLAIESYQMADEMIKARGE